MDTVKEVNEAAAKLELKIQDLINESGLCFEEINISFTKVQQLSKGYREYKDPACEIKINYRAQGDL